MTTSRPRLLFAALTCALVAAAAAAPSSRRPPRVPQAGDARALDRSVVNAALSTYMHGVTPELAESVVGRAGIPTLRALLRDPTFPRRDNVMAFLACLGDPATTTDIVGFLGDPPGRASVPEEDRALLLAPEALGRIAAHGDRRALDVLLVMTAPGSDGDVLARAAQVADDPDAYLGDLMVGALRGLAFSGQPEAFDRLADIATGRHLPVAGRGRLVIAASDALDLVDELRGDGAERNGDETDLTAPPGGLATPKVLDAQLRHHELGFTFANHVAVTNPMTDARLDAVLNTANLRVGRADTSTDVACCVEVRRTAAARSFGVAGDGLDIIDNSTEMVSVLNNSTARFKVVRQINYCGSAGTNIIGCGWQPGNGIAVVRMSAVSSEAVLWVHEYGHNAGRGHAGTSRYIMYGVNYGTNDSLDSAECGALHLPAASSAMVPADIGACGDGDGDAVVDLSDNCPDHANTNQADADLDGIGDACDGLEPACGNGLREGTEACDGADLGGQTCQGLGWDGGPLACASDCTFDDAGCANDPPATGCADADLDGYQAATCNADPAAGGGDCNDGNALIHPGAAERCNGVDDDCDGVVPPTETDDDTDGYSECQGDCNDANPGQRPGLKEICGDGIDQDCNGSDKRCPPRH